jgi:outer membrane protein OmpA-like peptidoglycan-associated protein
MNIKKTIFSCLLMLGFVSASAQAPEMRTEYVFNPHWYVQLQGGAQYTLGEVSFGDLLSPNVQLGVGYQFDKVFGARLGVNAWQSKAGTDYDRYGKWEWKWKYFAPSLDLTVNLSNLVCGYYPERLFNLSAFLGVGANIAFDNDEAGVAAQQMYEMPEHIYYEESQNAPMDYLWDGTSCRVVGRAGLMADFRLSDRFSVGLEVSANTLNDHYNSKRARNADWYFNGLVGVRVNLGHTSDGNLTFRRHQVPAYDIRYVDREVIREVEKPVYVDRIVEVTRPAEPLRRDIFFTINSSRIRSSETHKLAEIAAYLAINPEAKVTITGYADRGTGNASINERLGRQRSQVVTQRLINEYHVDPSRIVTDSKGDTEQPFDENDQNRVSICIAE